MRNLSFACFAFNGIQSVFTAYFVTYLVALGYDLAAAGFAVLDRRRARRAVPRAVGLARQFPCRAAPRDGRAGARHGGWRRGDPARRSARHGRSLAIGLVGAVVSATAVSWHGILLSETARLAPPGRVGAVTGGVLSFGQIGALCGPFVFSLLLYLTGGYGAGWAVCAIPALWVGITLLRSRHGAGFLPGRPAAIDQQ